MKILFVISLVVVLLWTLANIIWDVSLTEKDKHLEEEGARQRDFDRQLIGLEKELREKEEVLNRETLQLKEIELNYETRHSSVLELEATLHVKQNYLKEKEELYDELSKQLDLKEKALDKRTKELAEFAEQFGTYVKASDAVSAVVTDTPNLTATTVKNAKKSKKK